MQQKLLRKWNVQQNPLPKQQKRWLAKIAARERLKAIALDGLAVDEDWPWFGRAVEAGQGTEACSAARAAFTACTTVARNSGDG